MTACCSASSCRCPALPTLISRSVTRRATTRVCSAPTPGARCVGAGTSMAPPSTAPRSTARHPTAARKVRQARARFFKARLSQSRNNRILSLDLLGTKPHGCAYRPATRPVQAQSMLRKANFEQKRLILRREEGKKVLT